MNKGLQIFLVFLLCSFSSRCTLAQFILLKPDRVFDGVSVLEGWSVLVKQDKIEALGKSLKFDSAQTIIVDLKGTTLMPGLIEGHSHILLHPYNETSWDDQVLMESIAERVIRASNHLRSSLKAGFTTLRDLGTEGAQYVDVGIRQAIEKKIIVGPDLICAGPAIVATGSYGPNKFNFKTPQGADEADANDLIHVVRKQIGHGVDLIKIYVDFRWGPFGKAMPTFSIEEIKTVVETARSSGRDVVAHATTREGMRRAALAGVSTIEHGDEGDLEIFKLMKEHQVAWCPTLAAEEAVLQYRGWNKKQDPQPEAIKNKKLTFKAAQQAGVQIVFGGDVGVYTHGDNARELLLMEEYGMSPLQILQSATAGNAEVFHLRDKGRIKEGYLADLIAVKGDPIKQLNHIYQVELVMKRGVKFQ